MRDDDDDDRPRRRRRDDDDDDDYKPRKRKRRRRDDDDYDDGNNYSNSELGAGEWLLCILCSGIGCIAGIVYLIQGNPKAGKMIGISILFAILWTGIRIALTGGKGFG